jgi:hypothetical protein
MRIGTLHDFRRVEHRLGVSDPTEGTKTIKARLSQNIETSENAEKEAFRKFSGLTVTEKITIGAGVTLEAGQTSPDFFLLCFSSELSKAVQRKFDGADACAEIVDSSKFFERVMRALSAFVPVTFQGVHTINYAQRVEERTLERLGQLEDGGIHPALIKEREFKAQKELRAVWVPNSTSSIKPTMLCVPGVVGLCRDVTSML